MTFSEENVEKSIRETREAHDKYRASGLGLSALIITLSVASAYHVTEGKYPSRFSLFFLFPIILGLVHQTANFIGSLYHAKCLYYRSVFNAYGLFQNPAGMLENDNKAREQFDAANKWFSFSEYVCIFAVASLCLILLGVILKRMEWQWAAGFLFILAVILFACWSCRDKDLFSNSSRTS